MSDSANVRLDVDGRIATITIDREEKLNALNAQTMGELGAAIADVLREDGVRGAIITGAGAKAFVAGADIADLQEMTPVTGVDLSRRGQDVFRRIELSRKPIIAAINGFALGGGCELALACHIRLASASAKLGLPEIKLGAVPGYGGTVRLARLIGRGRALEMILTGEMMSAEEAYRVGLVNHVFPAESLLDESRALMARIVANAPIALGFAIQAVTRGAEMPLEEGLAFESQLFGLARATSDMEEGLAAFMEKRKPSFEGR